MLINIFKKSDKRSPQNDNPSKATISSTGVLSITTEELLKNKAIKNQYELLKDPKYRKFLKS